MRFLKPEFLYLFVAIPPILVCLLLSLRAKLRVRKSWQKSKLKNISKFSSAGREILKYFLMVLVTSLLIFALSRPQISYDKPLTIKKPLDILCLVDISRSMNTKDVVWSGKKVFRLDLVKEELRNFVKNQIGQDKNHLALIAFSYLSFYRSFFTHDASSLLFHIDYLNTHDLPPEGTDIGFAILRGLEMVDMIDNNPEVFNRPKYKRILILISDGEDLGEILDNSIEEAGKSGIPIYTIGAGSRNGDYIIEDIDDSGKIIYMTDDDTGEKIFSKLEEETLKKIARLTGGKYTYSQNGEALNKALDELLARETEKETKIEKAYYDIYHYLLLISFVLCLIIVILKQN